MFLDHELKNIQEAKSRLVICCDLRRRLAHIEVQDTTGGMRRSFANLTLAPAVAERILSFLRSRKTNRRSSEEESTK